jgi:hypothetical protein
MIISLLYSSDMEMIPSAITCCFKDSVISGWGIGLIHEMGIQLKLRVWKNNDVHFPVALLHGRNHSIPNK